MRRTILLKLEIGVSVVDTAIIPRIELTAYERSAQCTALLSRCPVIAKEDISGQELGVSKRPAVVFSFLFVRVTKGPETQDGRNTHQLQCSGPHHRLVMNRSLRSII